MKNKILFAFLIFVIFYMHCWSEEFTIGKLNEYKKELEKTYQEYLNSEIAREVDLYPIVLARIDMAIELYSEKMYSKEAIEEFEMIQLLTEAAKIQMVAAKNYAVSLDVQKEGEDILREINNMNEEISRIKQKMAKDKALRIQKDMENRFNQLQNELISVRRDARGTIISMSNILFDVGKSSLTCDLKIALAKVAGILLIYRDTNVIIEGHTDNTGSAEFNQVLSEDRAFSVKEFFIELGLRRHRLESVGYGFRQPVADNTTKEGRRKNRRVDIIVSDY